MKKVYHLSTCSTCKRILKELELPSGFVLQDIKNEPVTIKQLEELHRLAGSYEALFSKKAQLYKERDLKNETLTQEDYKRFILEHYTFLKRPVVVINNEIFIGNTKAVVQEARQALHSLG